MQPAANKEKVAIIGSGNWGSTASKIIGRNVHNFDEFDKEVKMWVFEEMINGQKLTDIINTKHENVKYLPNIKLPPNVKACPDLVETCRDATVLVFVLPHQFIREVCKDLLGKIRPDAKAVSLVKGVDVSESGLTLISDLIKQHLNIRSVSVLMGANIANEIAEELFSESTIGFTDADDAAVIKKIFNTPYFRVSCVNDVAGVEICGALKNIVALGAGFVDGLRYGDNCKAAIIRLGLLEMKKFAQMFYSGVRDETFLESCGVADLITTCSGGRNRKVAEAMVTTGESLSALEARMLGGQKLQGTLTAKEVHMILEQKNLTQEFPLFTTIYKIAFEGLPASHLVRDL
ncbi:NAD-dependent glycerol-3-phosphate dehydrogenase N-terminus-domain-containing protein [Catenaria anguillulae PL171]|uniref:Glycerol-3-phosphate dehydrogenase [NAD(+)] n=1 Tax=Catenaria anguillulae PL171 TaxID=765915 RepID=A0A1Y2HR44_9FUNG|nr:NAD-dependent glycerol-3-phosphate dehydrogenase N-terminus-domain-containing protein [Catenaria anguillulae PL171]